VHADSDKRQQMNAQYDIARFQPACAGRAGAGALLGNRIKKASLRRYSVDPCVHVTTVLSNSYLTRFKVMGYLYHN
jgi:hypothetical protein